MRYPSTVSVVGPKGGMTVSLEPRDVVVSLDEGSELRLVCDSPWPGELELEYEGPNRASVWIWAAAVVRWFIDGEERTTPDFNTHASREGLASAAAGDPLPTYVYDVSAHEGLIEVKLSDAVDAVALRQIGGPTELDRLLDLHVGEQVPLDIFGKS